VRPLQLIWQLLRWPGVCVLLAVSLMFLLLSNRGGPSWGDMNNALVAGGVVVFGRIIEIAGMRTLRMLPDGHRMMVRALALLTLLVALLLGGLAAYAGTRLFTADPLANIALVYVALSALSFLMFTRELRGPVKASAVVGTLAAGALVLVASSALPSAFSWLAAAACALLWSIALRSRDVPRPASADSAHHDPHGFAWLARLEAGAQLARTPAATILKGNRGLFVRLTDAATVTVMCAIVVAFIAAHWPLADTFALVITILASAVAALMLAQSWVTPAGARRLWLLSGASRTGIFRIAERTLIVNLIALGIIAWLSASALALLRGIPVGGGEALLMLAGILAGGLSPIYFGLLLPTLNRAWQRILAATLAGITVALGPAIWVQVVIGDAVDGPGFTHHGLLAGLVVTCLLLRAITIQRWKSIDWITTRSESQIAL
jgi:hypothetical protein